MTASEPPPSASGPLGDAERITAFVREHFAFVWRVLRRLGLSASDADDVAQRVMLVVARRIADIEPGHERSFLYQTAAFLASSERRTQRRRPEDPRPELDDESHPTPDPERLLAQRRARETLDAILVRMPEDLRAAFVLFEIEGLSKAEVAHALGIPEGTAASRLRRAREDFARRAQHQKLGDRTKGAIG